MKLHADLFIAVIVAASTSSWGIAEGPTRAACQRMADRASADYNAPREICKPVGKDEHIKPEMYRNMKRLHALSMKNQHVIWQLNGATQAPAQQGASGKTIGLDKRSSLTPDMPKVAQASASALPTLKFAGEGEKAYQARQIRCLATAIYFEARGESVKGQKAVAQVVMTRVRSTLYPDTICGVVYQGQLRRTGCQFSFTCDRIADVPRDRRKWRQANRIAKEATRGKIWLGDIGHATHYHANYVNPRWRHGLTRVKQVGVHIFYRVRGDQLRDVLERGA